jgi:hypothetical protein
MPKPMWVKTITLVPVGLECTLTQLGDDPLVFLDAMILPIGGTSRD